MNPSDYFAHPIKGDPANPEKHPHRYVRISCKSCRECWLDKLIGRCFSGGPYNENLEFDQNSCRVL